MPKIHNSPRISVNKLGQYIVSKAARQRSILYDQKFPADYITAYYKDAEEAIALFIASGMTDMKILENRIASLGQQAPQNIQQQRQILGNIEAIETFTTLMDQVAACFGNAKPRLGEQQPPRLKIMNVEVSVRPEIILVGSGAKGATVGAVKLHFPKTNPLTADACGYISAAAQMFCDAHLSGIGAPDYRLCSTVDLASGAVYAGVKSVKLRQKDIEAACQQIFNLWPTILKDEAA